MAEEDEVEKYKRLYEEQRARVKELERQNSQLKEAVQHLMSVGRQQGAAAAGASTSTSNHHNNNNGGRVTSPSVAGAGGHTPGNTRARTTPPTRAKNPSPAVHGGGGNAGRGGGRGNGTTTANANSTASNHGGGAGDEANPSGSGGGEKAGSGSGSVSGAAAAAAASLTAAARTAAKAKVAETPPEPDIRSDIVAMMREASMSKDKQKLEGAIKKAEAAGLHFEAKQGRRQLGRITG